MVEKNNILLTTEKITLYTIFIVILAGSIVRTTQSGMGCPDWPKCFGQWIPPTEISQIQFKENKDYKKKQFIIQNDSLFYAIDNFTSTNKFEYRNWKNYEKHNYATFKTLHTWVEYINRLATVLLGLFLLLQLVLAIKNGYFNNKKIIIFYMILLLLFTGFQAWLGKIVVDSNLSVFKITIHLVGAFVLLALQSAIVNRENKVTIVNNKAVKILVTIGIIIITLQICIGTQVREQIDVISKQLNYTNRELWMAQLDNIFIIHRSMSWLVCFISILIFLNSKTLFELNKSKKLLMGSIFVSIVLGIILSYINFPAFAQPLHLLSAAIIFYALCNLWQRLSFK